MGCRWGRRCPAPGGNSAPRRKSAARRRGQRIRPLAPRGQPTEPGVCANLGTCSPALPLAHGVGDPVCPLLQARGARTFSSPSRRVLSFGPGDMFFLHGAYRQEGESTLVLVDGLGLGPEGFHGPGQFLGGLQDLKQCLDGWLGLLPGLGQALCQSLGAQNFRLGGEIAHHHVHGVVKIGGHGELVGVGIFDSLQGLVDGLPGSRRRRWGDRQW